MSKWKRNILFALAGLLLLGIMLYQIPAIQGRVEWRVERIVAYANGIIYPAGPVPTALPTPTGQTETIGQTATPVKTVQPTKATITPTPTSVPLPAQVSLKTPAYELQDINNCGPATLTMTLRMYGWQGNQFDISKIIKPKREDRNVNPEEMVYYVRNYAGWLRAEYRVNGNITLIKRLLAAGFPVVIEETFRFEDPYWPNDDLWAAHYLLITGYDDNSRIFTGQDSFYGPDRQVSYDAVEENWKPFNNVYLLVYLPEQESQIRDILGADWDEGSNRQNALNDTQAATVSNPNDAFAWFNYGTNLTALENYTEAANAYDKARSLGLPQRMMRYQFGPFIAYFQSNRIDDLTALTKYALERTPSSEEAMLWNGWGIYRQGDAQGAITMWRKALGARPGYVDALNALQFVGAKP
ncbi:MAG: C39 family peptidase [Chloroflexi bacterium]|nr:C39 family peptidase [Chloroflexota bacterium]